MNARIQLTKLPNPNAVKSYATTHTSPDKSNSVDDAGGRYAKLTPSNVIGATSAPQYPPLPASSPWSHGSITNMEPLF